MNFFICLVFLSGIMILFHRLIFSLTSQSLSVIVELLCMLLFSRSVMSESLWPNGLQHARLPCPSLSPWVCSNSCLLSWWCHPTILSSVYSLSSCLQFPSIRVYTNELVLASGGQSIGVPASASTLPMNIQGWFPLGLTSLILLSKGLSKWLSR